ncbi:MAG: gliding motility-associated C-terminal domain-containing protein [Saprospiraceae bacterium]
MKNRLRMHWRVVLGFCGLFLWTTLPGLFAQQGFFNFSYPGPNTIIVNPASCSNILAGNIGTPTVSSTVGANIITSAFSPDSSNFLLTDGWNYSEVAEVIWFVEDDQGHSYYFSFFVSFIDTTKPKIITAGTPPAAQYASVSLVPPPPNLMATDSCSSSLMVSFSQTMPPPLCSAGTFTRTWLATDDSGNTGVFTQTITILEDTTPPVVNSAPQNGSASCTQVSTAFPAWVAAQMANFTATDPSGIASKTNNAPGAITGNCPAPVTVTFTVTDSCGFSTTRTATFTTIDNQGPDILRAPQDSLAACSPPAGNHLAVLSDWIHRRAGLLVKDSCSADNAIQYSMQINGLAVDSAQIVAAFQDSLTLGCGPQTLGGQNHPKVRGVIGVDFFTQDACGNTTYAGRARFGAIDSIPPVITGMMVSEECGGGNDSTALTNWINAHGNASVTDDCSGFDWTDFSWVSSTAQSGSGLFGVGPFPAVPANNCGWFIDVTFRATDDCGNTGSATLRFQLTDNTSPVFSILPNDTLFCPNTTPAAPTAFVSDNCDSSLTFTSSFQQTVQICQDAYTLLYTWIATDDCGNSATASQSIIVRDTTAPVVTLVPADITMRCDTFSLPPAPVLGQDVQATDICGAITNLTFTDNSGQNPDPGTCGHYTYDITRVFTVSDDCGNTGTGQQIIHIIDNIPPVISGFSDTTIVCEVQPITPPPTATDVCSGIATGPILESDVITGGDCFDSYVRTLSWSSTDICGNTGYFSQDIHVVDTVKPTLAGVPGDVFAECNNVPPLPDPGTITGDDNCDEEVEILFLETELRDPNMANCAHWTNYSIRREWTALDNCGNSRTYTQMITVQDNTGPVVVALDTVKTPTAPGLCSANTVLPSLVSVFDDCTSLPDTITLRDTVVLTPSGTPVDLVPVDTVVFSWAAPNTPPNTPVVGNATLAIALDNADSELPSETFQIYGEDGYLIGRTKQTNVSCGNSGDTIFTLPANLLNAWLTDGQLDITLAPNGSGANACNAFCQGGRARARLSYQIAAPQLPITISYSIDNGPAMPYPPAGSFSLDAGDHVVVYEVADCAGNSTTATTIIRIEDLEPPAVTPPAPITAYVEAVSCTAAVVLPFPGLQENCSFPTDINKSSGVQPVQFESDPNAGLVPKNAILNIPGILANAVTDGVLTIRHKGDNGNTGEFFRVLDELGMFLSTTTISASGECSVEHETVIPVTAAQINNWAANGVASFLLEANRDVVNYTDFISPCMPLNAGNFDGVSTLEAELQYNVAQVDFEIRKGAQIIQAGQLTGNQTSVSLPPGSYTGFYRVLDNSGNAGTATFPITILDTVPPVAACQPITIFTNPSGTVNYTLQPQEINGGSLDNCSGTNLILQASQTTFTCNMATPPNNIYTVTLTVTDTSGNSSTCTAAVQVQTVSPNPTVTPGVCEGGSVQLFANPPAPVPPTGYTYMWTGPNGFISMNPNPIIPNTTNANEGTYTVKVTGPTGCMSTGNVLLDLTNLPNQPAFQNVPSLICQGATLTLTVQQFGGTVVTYSWFSGTPANPTLLGTTAIPMFQVPNLAPGMYQFYVKVAADGCTSLPSDVIPVTVQQRPTATVDNAAVSVCTCETITLGTPVQGPGITYAWSGPGGFSSTAQYPLVTSCAQQSTHAGNYTLVISENGCASLPATVQVTVRPKPPKPVITGITSVCQGDTIQLTCTNIPTASAYYWFAQFTPKDTTPINTLLIPNATLADSGLWVLQVMQNNCVSDFSDGKLVQVQAFPNLSATSNSPICQGTTLNLTASSTASGVTYEWSGPNGFMMIGAEVSTNMPASGNYLVTVSTGFGCTNVATVPVTVIVPPEVTSVTNTAPDCVDCATDAVLQATIFTQNGPLMYTWSGPNNFQSTLPEPVIPKVCTGDNGTYNLVVKDSKGCISNQGSTTINVKAQPETPLMGGDQSLCVGSPLNISILNANAYGSNVLFEWHTPNGIILQAQSKLTIPITGLQDSGDYFLIVKNGDCASAASAKVTVNVYPIPPAPATSSNSPVCAGDTLRLFAGPIPGATYSWTGPSGFTSSVRDPFIPQANKATHQGCYSVIATVNGCVSPAGEGVCVEIRNRPPAPTILPVAPACLDQAGQSLTFKIAPATATTGAQYTWYNQTTMAPLGPPGFPLNFTLTDLSGLMPGQNYFYVRATLNGCASLASAPVAVTLDTIPNITAFAGLDMPACDAFPYRLQATAPMPAGLATGVWSQLSGPPVTIVNPAQDSSQVVGSIAGNAYKFMWSLSNGSCKNFSRDTVQVSVNMFENAVVCVDRIVTCFADSVELCAQQGQNIAGFWRQPLGQTLFQPPIVFENANTPITQVRNLPSNANTFFFHWILKVAGCPADTATVTVHTIGNIPFAGQDQNLCITDSCALLTATSLEPFETGKWTYLDAGANPDIVINSPNLPTTVVCDLQYGANRFKWETNGGLCGDLSRDTVVVFYDLEPTAFEDSIVVAFGQQIQYNVLQNDIVPPQFTVRVLEAPKHGTWSEPSKGTFSYLPNLTFAGTDKLIYELCNLNPACPCSMATLFFQVEEAGECRIPTIITPNGDGANDIFVIPFYCLNNGEEVPKNEVTIFNQWGDQVFHAQPYNNDWEGTYNGQDLPAGTYFYVVKLPAETTPRTGFLIIQR